MIWLPFAFPDAAGFTLIEGLTYSAPIGFRFFAEIRLRIMDGDRLNYTTTLWLNLQDDSIVLQQLNHSGEMFLSVQVGVASALEFAALYESHFMIVQG